MVSYIVVESVLGINDRVQSHSPIIKRFDSIQKARAYCAKKVPSNVSWWILQETKDGPKVIGGVWTSYFYGSSQGKVPVFHTHNGKSAVINSDGTLKRRP